MAKKVVRKKRVRWRCTVCKTVYDAKSDALACTRLPVEPHAFSIADKVYAEAQRTCKKSGGKYAMRGRVVKIVGPDPPNKKYVSKWIKIRGFFPGKHAYVYIVRFSCPQCKKLKEARYYAIELERMR